MVWRQIKEFAIFLHLNIIIFLLLFIMHEFVDHKLNQLCSTENDISLLINKQK